MQTINKIKIIKRAERDLRQDQTPDAGKPIGNNQKQEVTIHDAVTKITEWIVELRQKKNSEAAAARALLGSLSKA